MADEEECGKEVVKSLRQGSSGSLFTFFGHHLSSPTPYLSQDPPQRMCNFFLQDGFQPRGLWRDPWHHSVYASGATSFLTPKETFYTCAVTPLAQEWEIRDLLICYSNRVQPLSVPAITIILVSIGGKPSCYLHSKMEVNTQPRAHRPPCSEL